MLGLFASGLSSLPPFNFICLPSFSTCMHTDLLSFEQNFSVCINLIDCKVSFSFVRVLYKNDYFMYTIHLEYVENPTEGCFCGL